jgi:LPLT family lysophospholipid transporter-like MFS transporter
MQLKSSKQIHTKGFYFFLSAQFISALADNALLFAAIAMLTRLDAPTWHQPLLLQFFVFAYIALAPFVGAFADAKPKKQVMFISNGIKLIGCLAMLFGMPPLYAYGIVGIGAAAYSPAKYGILTEILPTNSLVAGNGWVEGSTVAAIILGAMFGGVLAVYDVELAIITISILYVIAAIFNKYMPDVPTDHKLKKKDPWSLVKDFLSSYRKLWNDPLGQLSLTITTLFWGAGATLRLVIIGWAAYALGYGLDKSTTLSATVALGVAIGAIIAAFFIKMKDSTKILPTGIVMGALVCTMFFITTWQSAAIILTLVGILSGLLIVPLNALLQHRGRLLIGAGHSIAVQNFNENLGILVLSGAYTLMVKSNIPINGIMFIFGFFVLLSMTVASIYYANANNN